MKRDAGVQRASGYRILHTIRSLRIDGVVKVVLRNVQHFRDPRFEHLVCSMHPDEGQGDDFRAHGIDPQFIAHRRAAHAPRSILRLAQLIRRQRIDLVHANRTLDLALAGTAARVCGIPVVNSLHWLGRPEDHPEETTPLWWQRTEKQTTVVLNRLLADRIIAVSEAVRDGFATLSGFPAERVEVVYPGLPSPPPPPDELAQARLRTTLGLAAAAPVVLNVGRLEVVKGQRHLIPMMCAVRKRHPTAVLVIAGDGELRDALTAQIAGAAELRGGVRLLGARTDVAALMAISDVVVLSSESEAAPLPVFEAMGSCKPVVATAVGGIPELVIDGETGLLVPRGDPAALAMAVSRLLDAPDDARRMGQAGRRRLRERFEIETSLAALERLYLQLLVRRA